MNQKEMILNNEDLYEMLDDLLREPKPFWEDFYSDRTKEIPFFLNCPDENLVGYFDEGLKPEKALEIGCGAGRNAIFMAQQGCNLDALDISQNAIDWGKERAEEAGVNVSFRCENLFEFSFAPNSYDFIYDCGLLHHLAPHRRLSYLEVLKKALKPNGYFGLVCFNTDGAVDTSDWGVYRGKSLNRGIGYTEDRLKDVFKEDFNILELRIMKKIEQPNEFFGEDFLWVSLMQIK
jgi:SAM-dependent methyltransferase